MKAEVEAEGGVKVQKSGGGRMCLMDMFGMDIPFRMRSGFRTIHWIPIAISS